MLVADVRATEVMGKDAKPPTLPDGLSAPEWRSMQELVAAAEYQFTWQVSDGVPAYRAPNRAHDLSLSLTAEGLHAARYSPDGEPLWDWGLSLAAYGGQTFVAIDRADLRGLRERVEVHRSRDVVEWYANGTEGLEHGLTLAAPPAGMDSSTVELTFALRGSLTPELDDRGGALYLVDASGETVLVYDQLAVYDAAGRALPARMRLSGGVQSADLQLVVDAAGATYPLTVDPLLHSQAGRLRASDAEDNDHYGFSVDVSGDTAVVGAYSEDGAGSNRGAAYVLARNEGRGTSWDEVIKLTASDAADDDYFGFSVAISGDAGTIVVGAHVEDTAGAILGAAYVFARNKGGADNWGQVKKLTVTGTDSYANFGASVDIDENAGAIAVGAYRLDGAGSWRGAAYVFARNKGGVDNWGMVKTLTAGADAEDSAWFGYSVAISHDTVVVGAYTGKRARASTVVRPMSLSATKVERTTGDRSKS